MNRTNIARHLKKVHVNFCNSIKDVELREDVINNSYITGGCITSLFLNEPVNDYDIYFINKQVAKKVAQYYCDEFLRLNPTRKIDFNVVVNENTEVNHILVDCDSVCVNTIAGHVSEKINIKPEYDKPKHVWDDEIDDWRDVVKEGHIDGSSNFEDGSELIDSFDDDDKFKSVNDDGKEKYRPVFISKNAITLSNDIQLVLRFCGKPNEVHKFFDFLHCTSYYNPVTGKVVTNARVLESIINKQLIYVGSKYPICSILRLRKFFKRGWTINAGQVLKICYQISKLDLNNLSILEDQLAGVDVAYFEHIITYLRSIGVGDYKTMDMQSLSVIIDKLIN
jgi:hypothetical protein